MNRFFFLLLFTPLLATSSWADEYVQDFEKAELGYPPDELMVIDGEFEVIEHEGGKIVKLPADPIIECGLLFGKSSKNAMTVEAKAFAEKRGRRSFPRFGVGVHGVSGYRVRVVPAAKKLELVHFEEVIHSEPFVWKSGEWCHLKLSLTNSSGKPQVKAWVWTAGVDAKQPDAPTLTYEGEAGSSSQGKASLWGTPYSGKDMLFDDLKVTWEPSKPKAE
ncbi:MAG: hypothetical protein GWQ08_11160 [Verrucomicrobiaceae bacterium]|nr:hypothetical protein [Verrucomicrobiaceae bacterium]